MTAVEPARPPLGIWRRDWAWFGFLTAWGAPFWPVLVMVVTMALDGQPPAGLCCWGTTLPFAVVAWISGVALGGLFRRIDAWDGLVARLAARGALGTAWGLSCTILFWLPAFAPSLPLQTRAWLIGSALSGVTTSVIQVSWFGYAYRHCWVTGRSRKFLFPLSFVLATFAGLAGMVGGSVTIFALLRPA